jgi:hypothetical protein
MNEQEVFDALKYRTVVDRHGTRRYYNGAGLLHRNHGPAIEFPNGLNYWFQNGQLHRTDGPAIEYAGRSKTWIQNGRRHRTDGPAVEYTNGRKMWFINGEELTEAEFNQRVKLL